MDQELASTLQELERKLAELERTLGALASAYPPAPAIATIAHESRARHAAGADSSPRRPRRSAAGVGSSTRPSSASDRRETTVLRQPSGAVAYPPTPRSCRRARRRPRRRRAPAKRPGPDGAAALPRAPRARGARADPRLRRAARTPKLRRCASAPTGPTISFARGAPSLDIVDVDGLQRRRRARLRERPRGHDRLRHRDRLPAPAQLDRRPPRRGARARARHERLDAGRRVPVRAARARRRRGDRRAPHLRPHAALAAPARRAAARGRARAGRHRHGTRSRACSAPAARSPTLAHIIPNFQNPAGYTLSLREAPPPARARRRPRLPGVRGRPLRGAALQRRDAADDALDGPRARRLRLLVLEDRLPRDPRRLPRRTARTDRGDRASSRPTPTSRRTWSPSRSSTSSAPRARSSARSRPSRRRWPSAPQTLAEALRRELPEAEFVEPARRLLHVGHAARGHRRARAFRRRRRRGAWRS